MGRRVTWLGVVGLGAVPALAEEPPAEVRSLREVQGPISAVDTREGTLSLTLEEPSGRVELRVDGETTIFLPGRTGRLADLKTGQRVRAAYEQRERVFVAQWIELLEP
ncbi:hypothetical protein [Hyalangium sp.]|uniref:hypothetical protein n=1 Tax=Hyalangium sp. TaxID=2028555 RepID=UPI002D6EC08C|nr:hypothetical protein [Hyalangium sp.]HYH95603.1 hypothetical protein [Hyalangium sp.]